MSIEEDELDRAEEKLRASGIDDLTLESMSRALSLSQDAINPAPGEDPRVVLAKAHSALVVGITHFMAGSRKYAAEIAEKMVQEHYKTCAGVNSNMVDIPWRVVAKQWVIKAPYAAAFVVAVAMVTGHADKLLSFLS